MLIRISIVLAVLLSAYSACHAAPTDLDTGFGSGGQLLDPFVGAGRVSRLDGRALAVSADRRSYIVGGANGGGGILESGFVGVLLENGAIAGDLGDNGIRLLTNARFEDLVLLPDGAVLACGLRYISQTDTRWLLARFRPDLSLDPQFADAGLYEGEFAPRSVCHAVDQLADGRIVVTGAAFQGATPRGFVAVLSNDGLPDQGFAGTGLIELAANQGLRPGGADVIEGIDDVLWVAAGNRWQAQPDNDLNNHIYRFTTQGSSISRESGNQNAYSPFPASSGQFTISPQGHPRRIYQRGTAPWQQSTWPVWETSTMMLFMRTNGSAEQIAELRSDRNDLGLVDLNGYTSGDLLELPDGRVLTLAAFRNASAPSGPSNATLALRMFRNQINPGDNTFFPGIFHFQPAGQAPSGTDPWPVPVGLALARNGRITVMSRRSSGQDGITLTRFQGETLGQSGINLDPDPVSFPAASGPLNAERVSEERVITGLTVAARVPLFVLGGEHRINGAPWSRRPVYVVNGDRVQLRGRAPDQAGQSHVVSLFFGGIRAKNSWDALGPRQRADFVINAVQNPLPGIRCSSLFNASNCSGPIPDGTGSLVSTLPLDYIVPGQCNFIRSVNVALDISHSYVGDLRVLIEDPNAAVFGNDGRITLIERPPLLPGGSPGTCSGDDVLTVIDNNAPLRVDDACNAVPGAAALSAELKPHQDLIALTGRRGTNNNGASAQASWRLVVRDLAGSDVGTLNDWAIDVQCSDTAPAIADLSVTAAGQTTLIPGVPGSFEFIVSNAGPAAATAAALLAELPSAHGLGYVDVTWTCEGSGGALCSHAAGCQTQGCPSPLIDPLLSLPANSSVTVSVTATPDPAISQSGLGISMDSEAEVRLLPSLDGAVDNQPDNNIGTHTAGLVLLADLRAEALSSLVAAPGEIEVRARFTNFGPSRAPDSQTTLSLPAGYIITSVDCRRGEVDCGGVQVINGSQLLLDTLPLLGNGEPSELVIVAGFAGDQPPGGQISLETQLVQAPGVFASDPNLGNNILSIATPTGPSDRIFRSGFQ